MLQDSAGKSAALLRWVGLAPEGNASIWSLSTSAAHVAWCVCRDWPVTADGHAATQHWFAGEWPKKDYVVSAVCWPEALPAPVWGSQPPPPPPPAASTPDAAFERFEHFLKLQGRAVTDAVQKLEAAAEHHKQTEERLQSLEATLDCESQMHAGREQHFHELVNLSTKQLTDFVTDACSSNIAEVKAYCENAETVGQQHHEMLANSMEQRLDAVTTHVEESLRSKETDVKQAVETRLQAHDAVMEATVESVETRITKRVCTNVLRSIFGSIQQIQNTSRVIEAFSLTQALCDAATDCADGEGGFDECLQPLKKQRSVSPVRIVQGKWV